jgi:hypothetical protein
MFMTRFIYQLNKFLAAVAVLTNLSAFDVMAQSSMSLVRADGSVVHGAVDSDPRLKTLLQDLHPGIYFENGGLNLSEKEATTLFTDVSSLGIIQQTAFTRAAIEKVTVQLTRSSELSSLIDLAVFNGCDRLKYVEVRASFTCSKDDLFRMLKNAGSQYLILLNVSPVN